MHGDFVQELLIYLALAGTMILFLAGFIMYKIRKSDKWNSFKEYFAHAEGSDKPIWKGIGFIIGMPLLMVLLLFGINKVAKGEEIQYFDYTSVFIGIDHTQRVSPFCEKEGVSDRFTSNMGVKQNIAVYKNFDVNVKYTHHSCAINPDSSNGYDAIGVMFEWKLR